MKKLTLHGILGFYEGDKSSLFVLFKCFFFFKKKLILLTPFRFLWLFFEDVSFVYLMRLVCLIWKDEVTLPCVWIGPNVICDEMNLLKRFFEQSAHTKQLCLY